MMKTLRTKTETTAADAYLKATNILKNFSLGKKNLFGKPPGFVLKMNVDSEAKSLFSQKKIIKRKSKFFNQTESVEY